MTGTESEGSLVRYYCTAGNGMERFLIDEVKKKLAAEHVCQLPGKVLFSSSARIDRLTELKAAERLFLLLKQDSPVQLSAHTSPAKAASVLQSRLLGDRNQWTSALMTWSRLQGELADRGTTVKTQKKEEEKCNVESSKSTGEQGEEENGSGRLRSGEHNGTQTLEKREKEEKRSEGERHLERNEEEELSGETCVEAKRVEKKRKRDDDEEEEFSSCRKNGKNVILGTDFSGRDAVSCPDHNMENSCRNMEHMAKDFTVENVKTTGGSDKSLPHPSVIKPEAASVPVSFRVNCKCTGSLSRYFSTQEVSRVVGVGLSRLLGWTVDLKNPQMEINVYLSDDHCLLGIPLTRLPLANRSYIKTTGLRATVAWAMVSLAHIQPGFCVVDPMCGVGTILIEAAREHMAAHFLGMDNDDGQLQKANENIEFAELGNRMQLLKASSMALPLPSASVDAVVCDLPFGRKFGTKTNMAANLPLILTEMERVLRSGGSLVLLLSPQLSCLLKKLLAQKATGPTPNQETKPSTGIHDRPSRSPSSTRQQSFQIHQGVDSSPTQETVPQSGLRQSLPPPLSSLKHDATFRVSLGVIDGLIHRYVKVDS
uniref:THUMP domain-containing protein 2 n=1 Tax=Semicossyphus pulcher TaxID=241346 RepID=UPI0037E7E446